MRAFVLALALLAALKIWAQDTSFRNAAEQALVAAYRDRAVTACRKEPQKSRISPELAAFATDWSNGVEVHLSAKGSTFRFGQFGEELWNAPPKTLLLVLTSGAVGLTCTFDLAAGTAEISRS
jgi:hypothetical protein